MEHNLPKHAWQYRFIHQVLAPSTVFHRLYWILSKQEEQKVYIIQVVLFLQMFAYFWYLVQHCDRMVVQQSDNEGIRTLAGRAQWISSPSP